MRNSAFFGCLLTTLVSACDFGGASEAVPPMVQPPFVADAFCGTRFRIRKIDPANEGAANHEIERGDEKACWLLHVRDDGTLSLFERIPSTVPGKPDGYCRVTGRKISNFQAESTGGDCLWYEVRGDGIWQVRMGIHEGGDIQLSSANRIDTALDTTLIMTDGLLVHYGRGALFHGGSRNEHPHLDPGSETDDLAGVVGDCPLDGCWTGLMELVSQEGCAENGHTPPAGETLAWSVSGDRSLLTPYLAAPQRAFPNAERCAIHTTSGSLFAGQWRVSMELIGDQVKATASWVQQGYPCRRTVSGMWSRCE
jgi:hypothetical protein